MFENQYKMSHFEKFAREARSVFIEIQLKLDVLGMF